MSKPKFKPGDYLRYIGYGDAPEVIQVTYIAMLDTAYVYNIIKSNWLSNDQLHYSASIGWLESYYKLTKLVNYNNIWNQLNA